ncbi:MAG TPA: hypothetical protein DCP47_07570 [Phycisphaerales bacterium]|nr:hypothetical protein [Phycisphaerales bacterium]
MAINKNWMQNSEVLIAIGIVSVIMMMIIPLPTFILDLLLAVNLTIGVIVILTVVYSSKAIDFSIFPSLLLLTTVFRLALNVSSTRLILLQGAQFEGKIIRAFGTFVVGGNYVVGIVVFLVLVMIQFLVITKGTTRVSEVAARFTLDAMPGKQMSIDADLNAGTITQEEANKRRMEIRQEADFYGAMDGASKFVQGDVIAGLIITAINILGGIVIGVWLRQEPFYPTALQNYTLLTVGDGLVNQVPSLLISVATGLIVTRAASKDNMGKELTMQLLSQPRALLIASGLLVFLGIFTPLPAVPMVSIGLICGGLGIAILRNYRDTLKKEKEKEKEIYHFVSFCYLLSFHLKRLLYFYKIN